MLPITHPTAIADQLTAATRDARAHLDALAAELAAPITPGPVPAWLTGHLSALHEAFSRGDIHACPHLTGGPGVACAAVWAPGLLACPTCAPLLLRPVPAEDATCDRCRRPTPHIHPGILAAGPVLLAYGVCPTCRTAPLSSPGPGRQRTQRQRPRGRPAGRRQRRR